MTTNTLKTAKIPVKARDILLAAGYAEISEVMSIKTNDLFKLLKQDVELHKKTCAALQKILGHTEDRSQS